MSYEYTQSEKDAFHAGFAKAMSLELFPQEGGEDTKRIDRLENRGFTFDVIHIWKTEKGYALVPEPSMSTRWFSTLREAIDDAMEAREK